MKKDRNPANERRGIYKSLIKGVEHFHTITVDVKSLDFRLERPKTETELRNGLKSNGSAPHEIDALVANAEWA